MTNSSMVEDTIYTDAAYRWLDVGSTMRRGHPDIAEGDQLIVGMVNSFRSQLGRRIRVVDVGSGSGDLSRMLAVHVPDCEIVANEVAPNPVAQARDKLVAFPHATVFDRPFLEWSGHADVVISWGSHHHLEHGYLHHVARVLANDGIFIIGDEFCPEYLDAGDSAWLSEAPGVSIVEGYLFADDGDLARFRTTGEVPERSSRLEDARRRALWTWYKFVGDFAVEQGAWDVLIAELAIARDDLITGFDGEHKTSPLVLERELTANGFEIRERRELGNRPAPLRSFVLYQCSVAAAAGR